MITDSLPIRKSSLNKSHYKVVLVTSLLLLSSCADSLKLSGKVTSAGEADFQLYVDPLSSMSSSDRLSARELSSEAIRIINTPEFKENFLKIEEDIVFSPFGKRYKAADAYAALLLEREGIYYVKTKIRWVNSGGNTNNTVQGGARIDLKRVVQQNWASDDIFVRSLSINTMAHELSHSVSENGDILQNVFTDRGYLFSRLRKNIAIASYSIGTVAQCTWLAEFDRRFEVHACLERYGLRGFNG